MNSSSSTIGSAAPGDLLVGFITCATAARISNYNQRIASNMKAHMKPAVIHSAQDCFALLRNFESKSGGATALNTGVQPATQSALAGIKSTRCLICDS